MRRGWAKPLPRCAAARQGDRALFLARHAARERHHARTLPPVTTGDAAKGRRRRSGRPPQADSDETRARLLRTATQSFSVFGYGDTPMSLLAEDAGITQGTLY